jgi:flavin reductase (DIM6/NTAB) family NADH-FMN oxidoreductase RutF
MNASAPPPTDSRALRDALGHFATGITVITARAASGERVGLTANSFNSVSLDPPLILWSLSLYSPTLPGFQSASHYAVNVLAADQIDLSQRFAASGGDKFAGLQWSEGLGGSVLLPGCCAWFECRNEARHAGGDHLIFVGLVERYAQAQRPPLIYQRGRYRELK